MLSGLQRTLSAVQGEQRESRLSSVLDWKAFENNASSFIHRLRVSLCHLAKCVDEKVQIRWNDAAAETTHGASAPPPLSDTDPKAEVDKKTSCICDQRSRDLLGEKLKYTLRPRPYTPLFFIPQCQSCSHPLPPSPLSPPHPVHKESKTPSKNLSPRVTMGELSWLLTVYELSFLLFRVKEAAQVEDDGQKEHEAGHGDDRHRLLAGDGAHEALTPQTAGHIHLPTKSSRHQTSLSCCDWFFFFLHMHHWGGCDGFFKKNKKFTPGFY